MARWSLNMPNFVTVTSITIIYNILTLLNAVIGPGEAPAQFRIRVHENKNTYFKDMRRLEDMRYSRWVSGVLLPDTHFNIKCQSRKQLDSSLSEAFFIIFLFWLFTFHLFLIYPLIVLFFSFFFLQTLLELMGQKQTETADAWRWWVLLVKQNGWS